MSWKPDLSNTVKIKLTGKLQEGSSRKYGIVHNSASLSPVEVVQNKEECPLKFKRLVERLEIKWISAADAGDSKFKKNF